MVPKRVGDGGVLENSGQDVEMDGVHLLDVQVQETVKQMVDGRGREGRQHLKGGKGPMGRWEGVAMESLKFTQAHHA
jgi:hypothetical protein